MNDVPKIKQACFLACLESFFADHGIQVKQECMIEILLLHRLCGKYGSVENIIDAEKILNLKISTIGYHYPIDKKYEDGSLLIGTTFPGYHCVRFFKQPEAEKSVVMDPDYGKKVWWDKAFLENAKPDFYKIETL